MSSSDGTTILRHKITDYVVHQIMTGAWRPGERIPSEQLLTRLFGVSRMTVHHALRDLATRGFVVRRAGSGTFVAGPSAYASEYPHHDIADEIRERGGCYRAELFARAERAATASEAEAFQIDCGAPLFHAIVLHHEDETPVELEDRLIAPRFMPDAMALDLSDRTLFARLMLLKPGRDGSETLRAVAATANEAALLRLEAGAPLLERVRKTWSHEGVVTVVRILRTTSSAALAGRIRSMGGLPDAP